MGVPRPARLPLHSEAPAKALRHLPAPQFALNSLLGNGADARGGVPPFDSLLHPSIHSFILPHTAMEHRLCGRLRARALGYTVVNKSTRLCLVESGVGACCREGQPPGQGGSRDRGVAFAPGPGSRAW